MASGSHTGSQAFAGVTVHIVSKVANKGAEPEDDWQEVDWVVWSKGELVIEGSSFMLIFKPTDGNKAMKAKHLGCLLKASGTQTGEDGNTFVVTTSDSLHRTYRFSLESEADAKRFEVVAQAAEAAHEEASKAEGTSQPVEDDTAQLEAAVKEAYQTRWPLVYGGSELFGPDPCGDSGSEVLLGRGVVVLLDPVAEEASERVGAYELLFYGEDDEVRKPVARFPMGSKMVLEQEKQDSKDPDGPAVTFRFTPSRIDPTPRILTFDNASVAAMFKRDFLVRQKVMELAIKHNKKQEQVTSAKNELEDLRQRGLTMSLLRMLKRLIIVAILAVLIRLAMFYNANKSEGVTLAGCGQVVLQDMNMVSGLARRAVLGAGTSVCEFAMGTVSATKVQKCMTLLEDMHSSESGASALRCFRSVMQR